MDNPEFLFDRRIVERHIERGTITRTQYEAHLAALPDRADNIDTSPRSDEPAEQDLDSVPEGEQNAGMRASASDSEEN